MNTSEWPENEPEPRNSRSEELLNDPWLAGSEFDLPPPSGGEPIGNEESSKRTRPSREEAMSRFEDLGHTQASIARDILDEAKNLAREEVALEAGVRKANEGELRAEISKLKEELEKLRASAAACPPHQLYPYPYPFGWYPPGYLYYPIYCGTGTVTQVNTGETP